VREALADTRVVFIAGPRQAGKSTLARMVVGGQGAGSALNLDDLETRQSASDDPVGLIEHEGILLIDEVQRVPDLLLAIKAAVDRDPRPGRFLLTGSANVLHLPRIADALPGRMEIVDLWPFSQGEVDGRRERFIDRAFDGWQTPRLAGTLTRREYLDRAVVGGFPEAVARTDARRRAAWFAAYSRALIQRELRQISAIEHGDDVGRLLRLIAARSGQLLNVDKLARDAAMAPTTTRRYLGLLEAAFIVSLVPAWANSRTSRALRAPKIFMTDTGLLAQLVHADPTALARPGGDAGSLLETFVETELRKQLDWSSDRPTLHHYRTKDGAEVDFVLEAPDGRVVGIEVKASSSVRPRDLNGLRHLSELAGDRFCAGLVLYTGPRSLPFGDGISCAPISALWNA